MIPLSKVLLKQSSDPNAVGNAGHHLGGCLLRVGEGVVERLAVSDDGNWIVVNNKRLIPREMVCHSDMDPPREAEEPEPEATESGVRCPLCLAEFTNRQALGGHKRHCPEREKAA